MHTEEAIPLAYRMLKQGVDNTEVVAGLVRLGVKKSTAKKMRQLASIRLGAGPVEDVEEFRRLYEDEKEPLESLADRYNRSTSYIKDVVRAFRFHRSPSWRGVWNKGKSKDNHPSLARLSEQRMGEGNPRYGKEAWNKGATKETDDRLAAVSSKLKGRDITSRTRTKMAEAKRGKYKEESNRWNGGRQVGGYSVISIDGVRHYEHRLIAERLLARPLMRFEHVHHKDRNRKNNDVANLVVVDEVAHVALHKAIKDGEMDIAGQEKWLEDNGWYYRSLKDAKD